MLVAFVISSLTLVTLASFAHASHEPGVRITSGPAGIDFSTFISFAFTSNTLPQAFECSFGPSPGPAPAWSPCTSPKSYSALKPGNYSFDVRRVSSAGTVLDSDSRFVEITVPDQPSLDPVIAGENRAIAFSSGATTLVIDDDDRYQDVFVYASATGTELVSLGSDGVAGNGDSAEPSISDYARYVAFTSSANNLVPGDTNGTADVFIRDLQQRKTSRVTDWNGQQWAVRWCVDSSGAAYVCSQPPGSPAISGDGRFVAFTGDYGAIYVYDVGLQRTVSRVTDSGLAWVPGTGRAPSMSDDGRYVAFDSDQPLVQGDTNGRSDVFVHDRWSALTGLVSVPDSPGVADGDSYRPSISDSGRYIAYESTATNLQTRCCLPRDNSPVRDIYLRDRWAATTSWVSTRYSAIPENSDADASTQATISGDGPVLQFASGKPLVPSDTNGFSDIYEWNFSDSVGHWILSTGDRRGDGDRPSYSPSGTDDGKVTAYATEAGNLVPGDTNGVSDVVTHTWVDPQEPPPEFLYGVRHLVARASNCGASHGAPPLRIRKRIHLHGRSGTHVHRYVQRLGERPQPRRRTGGIRARAAGLCEVDGAGSPRRDAETKSESEDEAKTTAPQPRLTPAQTKAARAEYDKARNSLWKQEANDNPNSFSESQKAEIAQGRSPTGPDGKPMEWHHTTMLSRGGSPTARSNLRPMTQTQHRLGGNYRLNHP